MAAVTLTVLAGLAPAQPARADPAPARDRTRAEVRAERLLHQLQDEARARPGAYGYADAAAPPLARWADLLEASRAWSDEQGRTNTIAHDPDIATHACCWQRLGENVARVGIGDVSDAELERATRSVVEEWMRSAPHRRNVVDPGFDHVAIGVSISGPHHHVGCDCWYLAMHVTARFREFDRSRTPPGGRYDTPPNPGGAHPDDPVLLAEVEADTPAALSARHVRDTVDSADSAVLARADAYADALAGATLAGALDGPLLLTPSERLDPAVAAELQRLHVSEVVLLGGPGALSEDVREQVESLDIATRRVWGADRFETADAVRRAAAPARGGTVLVVEGQHERADRGWPDAVAASWVARRTGAPVLLVRNDRLPDVTRRALQDQRPDRIVIVGGPAAVSIAVERALRDAAPGARTERVAGDDRYATSVALATRSGVDTGVPLLASGWTFQGALIAGANAQDGQYVLLAHPDDHEGGATAEHLRAHHRGEAAVLVARTPSFAPTAKDALNTALNGR